LDKNKLFYMVELHRKRRWLQLHLERYAVSDKAPAMRKPHIQATAALPMCPALPV
jgi:hypothetical protein